jgi:hypothetical protein
MNRLAHRDSHGVPDIKTREGRAGLRLPNRGESNVRKGRAAVASGHGTASNTGQVSDIMQMTHMPSMQLQYYPIVQACHHCGLRGWPGRPVRGALWPGRVDQFPSAVAPDWRMCTDRQPRHISLRRPNARQSSGEAPPQARGAKAITSCQSGRNDRDRRGYTSRGARLDCRRDS